MITSGKTRVIMMIVLGIFLFTGALFFALYSPELSLLTITIMLITVVLAAGAVVFSILTLKKTEKRIKLLPVEYQNAYLNAGEAVNAGALKRSDKRAIMDMILEIFEHAVIEERALTEVTGSDLKAFIQGFIEEAGGGYTPLYYIIFSTMNMFIFILLMKTYLILKAGGINETLLASEDINLLIIIFYGCISYIFLPWLMISIRKAAAEEWSGGKRLLIGLPFAVPSVLIVILLTAADSPLIAEIDRPLSVLSTPASFIISVIMTFVCGILLRNIKRTGSRNTP